VEIYKEGWEFSLDLLDMRWEMGPRSRFWHDLWCGEQP
jgi:hypothetical protein